ncbi:MAG: hypothetical protein K8I00_03920, partial [Candidatus Omnitrophica bacterium]|nr:hypothetical protein [Candidatus Omnitrophota bacterium]
GMDGLKLKKIKGKKLFNSGQFKDILSTLVDMERVIGILGRKGVDFEEYVRNYNQKTKKMPKYILKVEGEYQYITSDEDLANLTKGSEEAHYSEIFEHNDLELIQERLTKYDLSCLEYVKPDFSEPIEVNTSGKAKKVQPAAAAGPVLKPLYSVESEKDTSECYSLQEVLEYVRNQASKGMDIQRYKGLGEMNPQQLWDTTMDPKRRTILKVELEDAVEVDKTFSMLMGDDVAPRREFIETYAHEVEELDI